MPQQTQTPRPSSGAINVPVSSKPPATNERIGTPGEDGAIIVKVPGGQLSWPAGTPPQVIQADYQKFLASAPPPQTQNIMGGLPGGDVPKPGHGDPGSAQFEGTLGNTVRKGLPAVISGLSTAATMIPAFGEIPIGLRMALQGVLGAAHGGMTSESPTLSGGLTDMLVGGVANAAGETGLPIAHGLQRTGSRAALSMGGGGFAHEEKKNLINSAEREFFSTPPGRLAPGLGNIDKLKGLTDQTGKEIGRRVGALDTLIPEASHTPLRSMEGWSIPETDKAGGAMRPLSDVHDPYRRMEDEFINEQAVSRLAAKQGRTPPTGSEVDRIANSPNLTAPELTQRKALQNAIHDTKLAPSDLLEIKTNNTAQGKGIIAQRTKGAFVPSDANTSAQGNLALGKMARTKLREVADGRMVPNTPGKGFTGFLQHLAGRTESIPADLEKLDQKFGDRKSMLEASRKLRGYDMGAQTTRASAGRGLAGVGGVVLGSMFGGEDPTTRAAAAAGGGLAGMALLSPRALSAMGNTSATVARRLPLISRGLLFRSDVTDLEAAIEALKKKDESK